MAREGGSEAGRKAAKEGKTGTSELVSTIKVKKKSLNLMKSYLLIQALSLKVTRESKYMASAR